MKKLLIIVFIFFCYTGMVMSSFAQIIFKGNSPQEVVVGEQFRIYYTLTTTGERGRDLRLPKTNELRILLGPSILSQSSSTEIINGNISTQTQIIFTYILVAEKEGKLSIPSATIRVGKNEYKSGKLEIKVLSSGQINKSAFSNNKIYATNQLQNKLSSKDIFVQIQISKSSVYENEGFLVTFKLYSSTEFEINNIKFPEFDGFISQEIELPENKVLTETYHGLNYQTIILKKAILYPQRTGKISIGKGIYDVIVRVKQNKSQKANDIFDDFFDTYSDIRKTLISSPITIDVKELPSKQRPATFSGAVGEYKITSSISATKSKVNQPITIQVNLSGKGNIKLIKNPTVIFPNNFELYGPKIEFQTKISSLGVSGTKKIEYYTIPRCTGDFTIPCIQFTFFDLKTKSYKTIFTKKYQLNIEPSKTGNLSISVPNDNNGIKKEKINLVEQDIHHIKTNGFVFQKRNLFFGSLQYWLCYLFPFILFLVLKSFFYKNGQKNTNNNFAGNKKAYKIAYKRLNFAQIHLKKNQKEAFYEDILKSVWEYLSNKWSIPISNLSQDNIKKKLIRYGIHEQLIKKFISILHTTEFARYSPFQNEGTMNELYQQTKEAIQEMEKYTNKKR